MADSPAAGPDLPPAPASPDLAAAIQTTKDALERAQRQAEAIYAHNLRCEEFVRYCTLRKSSAPADSLLATTPVDKLLKEAEKRQLRPRDWLGEVEVPKMEVSQGAVLAHDVGPY